VQHAFFPQRCRFGWLPFSLRFATLSFFLLQEGWWRADFVTPPLTKGFCTSIQANSWQIDEQRIADL
jgi:hypothetical protein